MPTDKRSGGHSRTLAHARLTSVAAGRRGVVEVKGHEDLDLVCPVNGGELSPDVRRNFFEAGASVEGVRLRHERRAFESYEVEAEQSRVGEQSLQQLST